MKTLKIFWRDMRIGTLRHMGRFLVVPVVVFLMSSGLATYIAQLYGEGVINGHGTAVDYYMYIMQGMYIYKFTPESEFMIPISWFMLHIGMAYITAYYPYKDYNEYGTAVFLASGSRRKWWVAKMLWCMVSVALYYLIIALSCVAVAYAHGADIRAGWSVDIMQGMFGDSVKYVSGKDVWLITVILPFAVSMMLMELQMLLSFLLTPVVSFAATCGIYIISAYYTCWWLAGNYTMWIRSSYIDYEGIRPDSGMLLAVFGIVSVLITGLLYFREKDVLQTRSL